MDEINRELILFMKNGTELHFKDVEDLQISRESFTFSYRLITGNQYYHAVVNLDRVDAYSFSNDLGRELIYKDGKDEVEEEN